MQVLGGVVMFNSYEVGTSIVTFITKVIDEAHAAGSIGDRAKLDGISIADAGYAESEWGDRIYDPSYKKADWK